MKRKGFVYIASMIICFTLESCSGRSSESGNNDSYSALADSISEIVSSYPGEIGVAVIINNTDTITVNDRNSYPMMSVFKLHQAIALCDRFDHTATPLDTLIYIERHSLHQNTWSPMLKDHSEPVIPISVKELLRYTLIQSDNNASNVMFKRFVNVNSTDSMISTLIPRHTFNIDYSEEEMSADHSKAYSNHTSPLGAAMLINRLFNDSVMSNEKQVFIKATLGECVTGQDRIIAPLINKEGVKVAHKTGSGYRDNGILVAHNDLAYITLPNGINYSLAVFVKDFKGDEAEASKAIARTSATIYETLSAIIK